MTTQGREGGENGLGLSRGRDGARIYRATPGVRYGRQQVQREALRASCDQPLPPIAFISITFLVLPLPAPTPPLPQPLRPSPPALPLPCGEPPLRLARTTEPHTEPTCRPNDRVAVFAYPLPLPPALSGHFASRFFPHRHTRIDSAAVTQSLPLVRPLPLASLYLYSSPPAHLRFEIPMHASCSPSSLQSLISFSPVEQALS